MEMTKDELISLAREAAKVANLDPRVVCAVIEQESSWDPWAIRFEPAFLNRYVRPLNLMSQTEEMSRATSWGLMQVMGQVAREHGYRDKLQCLLRPYDAVRIGCSVLKGKLAPSPSDLEAGLLRYNGGGNPDYGKQVMARLSKYV